MGLLKIFDSAELKKDWEVTYKGHCSTFPLQHRGFTYNFVVQREKKQEGGGKEEAIVLTGAHDAATTRGNTGCRKSHHLHKLGAKKSNELIIIGWEKKGVKGGREFPGIPKDFLDVEERATLTLFRGIINGSAYLINLLKGAGDGVYPIPIITSNRTGIGGTEKSTTRDLHGRGKNLSSPAMREGLEGQKGQRPK